jgi:hypothetical protein
MSKIYHPTLVHFGLTLYNEGELYVFENNKIKPTTKNGYNKICQIVRKEFINQYIDKVN